MLQRVWLPVCEHITSISRRKFHWLPVSQRVDFKLVVLVLKALHFTAPQVYLAEDCQLFATTDRRQVLSSSINGVKLPVMVDSLLRPQNGVIHPI